MTFCGWYAVADKCVTKIHSCQTANNFLTLQIHTAICGYFTEACVLLNAVKIWFLIVSASSSSSYILSRLLFNKPIFHVTMISRSGVALAMRHRQQWNYHLRTLGREMSTPPKLQQEYGTLYLLPFTMVRPGSSQISVGKALLLQKEFQRNKFPS